MSDRDVVSRILHDVPDATFEFENDHCIYAKLNNKKIFFMDVSEHANKKMKFCCY